MTIDNNINKRRTRLESESDQREYTAASKGKMGALIACWDKEDSCIKTTRN